MSHESQRSKMQLTTSEAEQLRVSRRVLVGGAAATATGLALVGVQAGSAAGPRLGTSPRLQGGDQGIIIGTLGEASTINPFQADESESDWRCKMLFDEFVRPDPETYAATPGIA